MNERWYIIPIYSHKLLFIIAIIVCVSLIKNLMLCVYRSNQLKFHVNLYQLQENRQIQPKTFMHLVSNILYSRRSVVSLLLLKHM